MTRTDTSELVFEVMRTRRSRRSFGDTPVSVADLRQIIAAARWASSAGNLRLHRFFVTRDRTKINLISAVGPGFYGNPTAVIAICTNLERSRTAGLDDDHPVIMIDVGMAAMNMQLMAHALGLVTTPMTSVSRSGLIAALDLPDHLRPELILQLGHRSSEPGQTFGSGKRITPEDLTDWEVAGGRIPEKE